MILRFLDVVHAVDIDHQRSARCPGAVQIPYVDGSEPRDMTACGATALDRDKESLWKKWFGKDD